jgi:DNA-binding transcriptional ArsR family regulator
MAKRPDTSETVRIVLEILRRIPRTRKVTASELHAQLVAADFDRNLRTVQRHLDALAEGFDIECDDRSKPYGYRWRKGAQTLSLPALTSRNRFCSRSLPSTCATCCRPASPTR